MPDATRTRATIFDVAEAANVSITTVSHVFSGKRRVNEATRQRAVLAQQFARCLDTVDVAITASSMNPACPVEDAERCEYTYQRQARAV